jgi:hypothetical protein
MVYSEVGVGDSPENVGRCAYGGSSGAVGGGGGNNSLLLNMFNIALVK